MLSSVTMGACVGAGECMSLLSQGKPGYRSQVSGECSMDTICFHVGETIVIDDFRGVVLEIGINTQKPPCGNREAFKAIFSCPKVVQIENTTSGKHVNTPNKWGDTYLFEN